MNELEKESFYTSSPKPNRGLGGPQGNPALYSAFRIFSQTLFEFKKSISGTIELKFSGKTLYAIL